MTATKSRRATAEKEEKQPAPLPTKITEEEVLAKLGRPSDLRSIDVHRYDTSRCRVNVRREMTKEAALEHFRVTGTRSEDAIKMAGNADHSFAKTLILITDSFYLRTNYDGSLRSDNAPIVRKY